MKRLTLFITFVFFFSGLSGQTAEGSDFTESEIILKTSPGDIYGTLTVPNNIKVSPVVIIIPGTGPTDRNCNSPVGLNTNSYKMLANNFAKNGISTLRFDKRGVAESKGALKSERGLRFETYVGDVVDWVSLLRSDKRFSKIIIAGHSEGSLIGMLAAEKTKVDAFISIAGAGKSADKILQEQTKKMLPPQLIIESDRIIDSLRNGKTVTDVSPSLAMLYRPDVQPYMISWIKYDPAAEIKKLDIPVLIIQGTTDLQVSVDDAKLLARAKSEAKLLIIDKMNHVLKESEADYQKNMSTYSNPGLALKHGLTDEIVNFIKSVNK